MIAFRKNRRPAPGRFAPAAYAASMSVALAGALALLAAPLLPAGAWAQTAPAASEPPTATLTGTMSLKPKPGELPRLVPVTLTPQGNGGYDVHYEEQFRCHVALTYNGYVPEAGHLYTASVAGTASGGMGAYCVSVGGKGKRVLLRPRADGQPGYSYEDQAPTGSPVNVAPAAPAKRSP
ncbi:hypothetical protein [Mitsuaria sp. GD03876]|uniref:hypothetical protein n=1 Tax=Mitsuaria sp. GD03876 TaxID=2975399 RepID=UPI00244B94B7|nr:hypothetical protein [Mitsuaria sp. GD03876]MDH0867871.1 hypothetical protein [Mitsuaria sp. GD03876]